MLLLQELIGGRATPGPGRERPGPRDRGLAGAAGPEALFFVHIPKCAGSSFRLALKRWFGAQALFLDTHDPAELVADRDGHVPPALAPGADPALAPHARVLEQPLLGRRGHRRERVVDQIRAVTEDREAVAVGEQVVHAREPI